MLVDRVERGIAGYYTLSATSILAADFPGSFLRRLPRYPSLPGILLGRLAVDSRYQGQGLGRRLLVDALRRAREVTSEIGALVVVVDALHEAAAQFYQGFGFERFEDTPLHLFLPISDIRDL